MVKAKIFVFEISHTKRTFQLWPNQSYDCKNRTGYIHVYCDAFVGSNAIFELGKLFITSRLWKTVPQATG